MEGISSKPKSRQQINFEFHHYLAHVEDEIKLSPEWYRDYWVYYHKGLLASVYKKKFPEYNLHEERLALALSEDQDIKRKGIGYMEGYKKGLDFNTRKTTKKESVVVNGMCLSKNLYENLLEISKVTGVKLSKVRKAAYVWYCRVMSPQLGIENKI